MTVDCLMQRTGTAGAVRCSWICFWIRFSNFPAAMNWCNDLAGHKNLTTIALDAGRMINIGWELKVRTNLIRELSLELARLAMPQVLRGARVIVDAGTSFFVKKVCWWWAMQGLEDTGSVVHGHGFVMVPPTPCWIQGISIHPTMPLHSPIPPSLRPWM